MLIGIDGNEANISTKVGIGEYAFQIINHLSQIKSGQEFRVYLKNNPNSDLPKETQSWKYKIIKPTPLWTQFALPFKLFTEKTKPDVFFSPTHYAPRFSPVSTVISIMDLSYIHFPELFTPSDLFQLKNWTEYSVRKASKIITISNSSKNDIIKIYQVPENKVSVVYPGIKDMPTKTIPMDDLQKKYSLPKEYILFVGTLQPRKNIVRLVEAFSLLKHDEKFKNKDIKLVLVGKKGWQYEPIMEAPEKYNVADSVIFLDFVSDEDLPSLYKHAQFYILPSLYEGFGLPVLEAMKYDCPVITSNISSMPEAGGNAALYVDPENVTDITEKMVRLLTDKKLQNELIEKGKKQVSKFSWEKAGEKTLEILEDVGHKNLK